jgi:hypothetical protein
MRAAYQFSVRAAFNGGKMLRSSELTQSCRLRVTNGPRGPLCPTSVDPPIPDEIAALRKSAVPCQYPTHAPQQTRVYGLQKGRVTTCQLETS